MCIYSGDNNSVIAKRKLQFLNRSGNQNNDIVDNNVDGNHDNIDSNHIQSGQESVETQKEHHINNNSKLSSSITTNPFSSISAKLRPLSSLSPSTLNKRPLIVESITPMKSSAVAPIGNISHDSNNDVINEISPPKKPRLSSHNKDSNEHAIEIHDHIASSDSHTVPSSFSSSSSHTASASSVRSFSVLPSISSFNNRNSSSVYIYHRIPVSGRYMCVTDADGERVYLSVRNDDNNTSISHTTNVYKPQQSLLRRPIGQLIAEINEQVHALH